MRTQHSLAVSPHEHTHGDYLDRLDRYEQAIKVVYQDHDLEAVAELISARQSMSDISRIANRSVIHRLGKALKDWATAIMAQLHITRDNARAWILDAIKVMTGIENEQPGPKFNVEGCTSGRITSAEPNFTEVERRPQHDHLPEGSY